MKSLSISNFEIFKIPDFTSCSKGISYKYLIHKNTFNLIGPFKNENIILYIF